jgi:hypothetical protein
MTDVMIYKVASNEKLTESEKKDILQKAFIMAASNGDVCLQGACLWFPP